ncbi:three-Cys-motif partner protein TcmP [Streptomyces lavenduligriseus]|uniref:Three-Cys-motif partner protein TcmP n=1 Tax=Streptomyces lavenduligriseus TaxID=67315 RepID=A0ABT0P345_9ACTN|nr:three-Cys-motif partner protein TcmP [Streptomyces lavenduligriseus]MCL3998193.1 three-Cys-motif partner protein TcmP [Streptomyces lavenduligriseus]
MWGWAMSSGTGGGYWADKALPSVFKHELLRRYLPQFGGMTGTQSHDKRVVYLDGYAGEGRYENGDPASAEIALRVASYLRGKPGLTLECFFSEPQAKSFDRLHQVVQHYLARGVRAHAHRGEVDGVLDQVVERAVREPLFLFLDPCGLVLPQDRLVDVLAHKRPQKRPATELLMNFSMMAVWRLGGHVRSPKGDERSLRRFDDVCGGTWWREYFADAVASRDTHDAAADAIEAVAAEYARRLARRTGMLVQSVPVSHSPRRRAVYRLVFATRSPYGLWVFGDTVARARATWWETLEEREEDDALFSVASVTRPDPKEVEARAVPEIAQNLAGLLARTRRPVKLVDHTLEVFGSFYGQVTEPVVRQAVRLLHEQGGTPSNGVGVKKTREITLYPGNLAA